MRKFKKLFAVTIVAAMMASLVACGSSQAGEIEQSAAVREQGSGDGAIYIDDKMLALAGEIQTAQALTDASQQALSLVNDERGKVGIGALSWNVALANAALVRATELPTAFSHTRPNGSEWWTVDSNTMYGENLAKLYNDAVSVVAAWMASPTHKENIMDGGFTSCGISIYDNGGSLYWAQEFGY